VLTVTSAQFEAMMGAFLWPFIRVLALVMSAPMLGHKAVPRRVKVGLALLITILVAPGLPPVPAINAPSAFILLLQQLLIGLALGFAMHVAFAAVQLAGDMIGMQMGLSFANFIDPQHSGQSPVLGMYLGLLATLVFLGMDGHLMLIAALAESFRHAPIGADMLWGARWSEMIAWGGALFRIGLHLALPVLAAIVGVNLALGVLMRAAPQLNLFSVGFPITLIVGMAMLVLLLPYLGAPIQATLAQALQVRFSP